MANFEKARTEWRRFQTEDSPAFERWLSSTFGAILTELRENSNLIRQQRDLINEVHFELFRTSHCDERKAYADVMKRRQKSEPEPPPCGLGGGTF